MKKKIIRPSAEEDAETTQAAISDPDSPPLTEEEWNEVRHRTIRGHERPPGSKLNRKEITES